MRYSLFFILLGFSIGCSHFQNPTYCGFVKSRYSNSSRNLASEGKCAPTAIGKPDATTEFFITNHTFQNSDAWMRLLQNHAAEFSDPDTQVVEVGPGFVPKIGMALSYFGFRGTLHVIEPNPDAAEKILAQYKLILPYAKVVVHKKPLAEALNSVPKNILALLANHPMDDFITGKASTRLEVSSIFSNVYTNREFSLEQTSNIWNRLQANPELLGSIKQQVVDEWVEAFHILNPQILGISQYKSNTLQKGRVFGPDIHGYQVLQQLQKTLGIANSPNMDEKLRILGQPPDRWLIVGRHSTFQQEIRGPPEARERLGSKIFVNDPVYRLNPDDVSLAGVDLQQLQFQDLAGLGIHAEGLNNKLTTAFAIKIANEGQTPVGRVLVDRQSDPMNIAMSGNLGSGRAAYVGKSFNVKGLGRTSLAKADPTSEHGDGKVIASEGLWEMVVANVISENFATGSSPVSAVLRMNGGESPKGTDPVLVVRRDNGTLDRPAHILTGQTPLPLPLEFLTRQFAIQDAEKFMQRIVHGAWSVGNISLRGDMLDFQTVGSVIGRSPQYSYRGSYPDSYFGLEYLGQQKVISTLAAHEGLSEIETKSLIELFSDTRFDHMESLFLQFSGANFGTIRGIEESAGKVHELTMAFYRLAQLMYPRFDLAGRASHDKDRLSVFDFSKFLCRAPLLMNQGYTKEQFVSAALEDLYSRKGSVDIRRENPNINSKMTEYLTKEFVVSEKTLADRVIEAQHFLADYYDLFSPQFNSLSKFRKIKWMARAFVVNQDRIYLHKEPVKNAINRMHTAIEKDHINENRFREILLEIIAANNRVINHKNLSDLQTHHQLYLEGSQSLRFTELEGKVYWEVRISKNQSSTSKLSWSDRVQIKIGDHRHATRVEDRNGYWVIQTAPFDFNEMYHFDSFGDLELDVGGEPYRMTPFFDLLYLPESS